MQRRVSTAFDQDIENLGWDRIRSRVEIRTKDGRTLTRHASEVYRGGPDQPLSDTELHAKLADNARDLLDGQAQARIIEVIANLDNVEDAGSLSDCLDFNALDRLHAADRAPARAGRAQ